MKKVALFIAKVLPLLVILVTSMFHSDRDRSYRSYGVSNLSTGAQYTETIPLLRAMSPPELIGILFCLALVATAGLTVAISEKARWRFSRATYIILCGLAGTYLIFLLAGTPASREFLLWAQLFGCVLLAPIAIIVDIIRHITLPDPPQHSIIMPAPDMTPMAFACSHCGAELTAPVSRRGRIVQCPECKKATKVL